MFRKTIGFKRKCPECGEVDIDLYEGMCITCRRYKEYLDDELGGEDDTNPKDDNDLIT